MAVGIKKVQKCRSYGANRRLATKRFKAGVKNYIIHSHPIQFHNPLFQSLLLALGKFSNSIALLCISVKKNSVIFPLQLQLCPFYGSKYTIIKVHDCNKH